VRCPQCRREAARVELVKEPWVDGAERLVQKGIGLYSQGIGLAAAILGIACVGFAILVVFVILLGLVFGR
jgi:hypothetical protein